MAFPGGAGYGEPAERDRAATERDLALGYITAEKARDAYGLPPERVEAAQAAARKGELPA